MLITNIILEIEREINMRRYVFPKLQKEGRITALEANTRIETLLSALKLFYELKSAGVPTIADALIILLNSEQPIHIKGTE